MKPRQNPPSGYLDAGDPSLYWDALAALWVALREKADNETLADRIETLLVAQDAYVQEVR